jgi:hypothetical protein
MTSTTPTFGGSPVKKIMFSIAAILVFATCAIAGDMYGQPGQPEPHFAEHKAKMLHFIDERIQKVELDPSGQRKERHLHHLHTLRACVEEAVNHSGIKACREQMLLETKSHL